MAVGRRGAAASLAAAALLLAAACTSLPAPTQLERHYAGRFTMAVTHHDPGQAARREGFGGRFALQVGAQALALDLLSPLGSTIARFETDDREARLLVPDNGAVRIERGPDAQALAQRVLGWSLPVAGMADWIEGRPAPQRPFERLPAIEGAERFEQDGWSVIVEAATPERSGRRLQIERAGRDGTPDVALRIVLDGPDA